MKRFSILIISFFLLYCSNSNDGSLLELPIKVLDLESHQLVDLIKENPGVLLDIRTPNEVNDGHLENASFIDYYDEDFLEKASWIKKDQPIYIYCHAGGRSAKAANQLISLGFKEVYNLIGGYSQWKDNDFPVVEGLSKNPTQFKSFTAEMLSEKINLSDEVILVFKTPWCLPCKKLDPVLDSFKLYNPGWDMLIINMDNNKDIANIYDIKSVPSTLIFKNHTLVHKEIGYMSYDFLMEKAYK